MTDDTAYVQDLLDKGLLIPEGNYDCPDGVTIPGDYIERAIAAGRGADERGGLRLAQEPGFATIRFAGGGYVDLCGWIYPPLRPGEGPPPGIGIGKDGCCVTYYGTESSFDVGGWSGRAPDTLPSSITS